MVVGTAMAGGAGATMAGMVDGMVDVDRRRPFDNSLNLRGLHMERAIV